MITPFTVDSVFLHKSCYLGPASRKVTINMQLVITMAGEDRGRGEPEAVHIGLMRRIVLEVLENRGVRSCHTAVWTMR